MDDNMKLGAATPSGDLYRDLMNPNIPKNEREWFAARKIAELESQLAALTALPEDLEGLCGLLDTAMLYTPGGEVSDLPETAAQALRAYAAREAQRDRVDAEIRAMLSAKVDAFDDLKGNGLNDDKITAMQSTARHCLSILDTAKPAEARTPDPWDALVRDVEALHEASHVSVGAALKRTLALIAKHRPQEAGDA